VPETVKPRTQPIKKIILTQLDLEGFLLFAPAAIMVFLALEWGGNKYHWYSATIIGLFCGSGATLILFGLWEWRQGDKAMAPFSILRLRPVWTSCFAMFLFFGCLQIASYYLPIYFQTVRDSSPMISGVWMLPNVLSQLIATVASGTLVGRMGYYLPWMVAGGSLSSVGLGLISTWNPTTSAGKRIGYQILLGFSRGLAMQMPLIAVQNSIHPKFVPVSMALVSFGQTFGGAVFLSICETILSNQLAINLPKYAPGVSTAAIVAAGGSGSAVRAVVGNNPTELAGTLAAYAKSVNAIFWFGAAAAALCAIVATGMGWKDIRKKEAPPKPAQEDPEKGLPVAPSTANSSEEATEVEAEVKTEA
jgi:MFS family permease